MAPRIKILARAKNAGATSVLLLSAPFVAGAYSYPSPIGCDGFTECVVPIINTVGEIAIIVAVIMIVVGGFMMVTAFGDTGKLQRARGTLSWAVIGLVIILAAYGLALAFDEIVREL